MIQRKTSLPRQRSSSSGINLGFQIAPMIDVVFVILLFFVVQAADMQVENAHHPKLPSVIPSKTETPLPDEIAVQIGGDGQVYLNDEPLDGLSDGSSASALPELAGSLRQIKQAGDASRSQTLVSLYPDDGVNYQRVMDVLDAVTQSGIGAVTFQSGAAE